MQNLTPSQNQNMSSGGLQPHTESPLRRFVVIGLVLSFMGGGFWYYAVPSKEDVGVTTKISTEKVSEYHASSPETTVPPAEDFDGYTGEIDEAVEYDYEWGASTVSGYNTFTDFQFGFSVDYPQYWEFDPTVDESGTVVSFGGYETIDGFSRYGSASIGLMSVPPEMTIDQYDQESDDGLLSDPAFTFIDRGEQILGAYDGRYIVGTYDFGDGIGTVFLSVVAVHDGVGYIFNCLFDYGDDSSFDPVLDHMSVLFDTMMASFVVNSTPDFSDYYDSYEDTSIGEVMLNDLFELRSKLEEVRDVRSR